VAIKLGVLALLLSWTFEIVRPFVNPLLWSIILAVALEPIYNRTLKLTKGRKKLAAATLIFVFLVLILVPSFFLVRSAIRGANELKEKYENGELTIAEVDAEVTEVPLVGSYLHDLLTAATTNLKGLVAEHEEELVAAAKAFINALVGTGTGIVELLLALIIGIILLATPGTQKASDAFFERLAGTFGSDFMKISQTTIKNVVKGVLGVAIIQSILIGVAFLLADIPYAGVWAILVLILSVIQLPPMLVTLPVIVYLFTTRTGLSAGFWTVIILLAGASDNVLKPFLMGRGSESPMLVIFFGSLGGFIAFGFIGLFLGAIILALVYKLVLFWLDLKKPIQPDEATPATDPVT
jgi:predicted PurR-regulated permease PerM